MTSYAAVGNRHTAIRMLNAEARFLDGLKEAANLTEAEAIKVLAVYRKARVVKMDAVGGVLSVKHGAFWGVDVIRRALALA